MFPAYAYLSAYDRHKKLINDYFEVRGGSALSLQRDTSRDKTDYDVVRENHKFLWDEENDAPVTWAARLAKKYYDKLFKEYCICDLTYYKYNKVCNYKQDRGVEPCKLPPHYFLPFTKLLYEEVCFGFLVEEALYKVALRWRTEQEVVVGKGQFECASKKCEIKEGLRTWEVNFGYEECGKKKNALVKLRLCPECSTKLNYKSQKREVRRRKELKRLGKSSAENREKASSSDETADVEIKVEPESDVEPAESVKAETDETEVWKSKPVEGLEKSREEEFEAYLADLFL